MRAIVLMLAATLCCGSVNAAVPRQINYQGYLTSPGGTPVNATVQMVLKLYDVATAGTALHTETQSVVVANGVFNVLLGAQPANLLVLPFDVPYWLGAKVEADAEMTPRQPVAAAGYAIRAASAEALAPIAVVPGAQLANASVTAAKLASNGCSGGQILKYNGSAWACAADDGGGVAGGLSGQVLVGTGGTPAWSGSPTLNGNLSVGSVNAAAARLDVAGSGWFRGDGNALPASAAQGVRVFHDTFSGTGSVFAYDYVASNPLNLTLQYPGGNVGIGTTIPGSRLTVAGRIESTAGGVKFPDGTVQATAASGSGIVFNVTAPQANILTAVDTLGDVGQYTSITVAPDGLPVLSYSDATNGDLKVAKCGNAACSSGNTLTAVDTAGLVGRYSSIAIGADGLPVISYDDQSNGTVKVAKCGNAACSSANTLTTVASMGGADWHTSIAIGADGLPVISYRDSSVGYLKLVHCGNAACSAGNSTATVDASAQVGEYSSIAVGVDGLPVISYYDNTNSYLKVAHCGDAACLFSATLATVDIAGVVGEYTSITIGADGLPVIAYRDATANDLKVAKCGNANCSAGNTLTAVDTVGVVGLYTSIAIGADGLPVISYYDGSSGNLKAARCGNAACSSGNTLIAVDSVGNLGQYTSITIGADGQPVISYYDAGNGDMKVAKCGNAFCSPYFRRR